MRFCDAYMLQEIPAWISCRTLGIPFFGILHSLRFRQSIFSCLSLISSSEDKQPFTTISWYLSLRLPSLFLLELPVFRQQKPSLWNVVSAQKEPSTRVIIFLYKIVGNWPPILSLFLQHGHSMQFLLTHFTKLQKDITDTYLNWEHEMEIDEKSIVMITRFKYG